MKLVNYNAKDDIVMDTLELGNLSGEEIDLIETVLNWMEEKEILDRYSTCELCENCVVGVNEDGERQLYFL